MTRAVAVIPARFASLRFPGKPLADVGGKPLIRYVWERACRLQTVERRVVATDDERIAKAVREFGGEVVMTGATLASGTDRVAEAVRAWPAQPFDVVVNLQGDEPVFDVEAVDELVRVMLDDPTIPMGTLAHPFATAEEHRDPNRVKVVLDSAGFALYFSRAPIPFARRPGLVTPLWHLGLYVFRAEALQRFASLPPTPLEETESLEQLRALEHGIRIRVLMAPSPSIGVNTPADLAEFAAHLLTSGAGGDPR